MFNYPWSTPWYLYTMGYIHHAVGYSMSPFCPKIQGPCVFIINIPTVLIFWDRVVYTMEDYGVCHDVKLYFPWCAERSSGAPWALPYNMVSTAHVTCHGITMNTSPGVSMEQPTGPSMGYPVKVTTTLYHGIPHWRFRLTGSVTYTTGPTTGNTRVFYVERASYG